MKFRETCLYYCISSIWGWWSCLNPYSALITAPAFIFFVAFSFILAPIFDFFVAIKKLQR